MKEVYIGLWKTKGGNALSSIKGLSQNEVDSLKKLKAGDRLIIYVNEEDDKLSASSPDYSLKKFTVRNPDTAKSNEGGSTDGI